MVVKYPCCKGLQKLKEGYKKHSEEPKGINTTYQLEMSDKGQTPYAAILSCADSRVIPESIFSAKSGDLFVVRVAGNIANTASIASLEYAVKNLGVRVIVVLGHQSCGAVGATIDQAKKRLNLGPNLNQLLAHIVPAINQPTVNDVECATKKNAKLVAKQLVAQSRILNRFSKKKGLSIFHGYYHISDEQKGEIDGIDKWKCNQDNQVKLEEE